MPDTFFSYSFGCRVNEAEKLTLDRKLLQSGFSYNPKDPDFYIINSCAVTGKAEREVRQHIYQIRRKFPKTTIVVTGCAATHWLKNNITINGADILIDNKEKMELLYHIISHMRNNVVKKSRAEYGEKKSTILDKTMLTPVRWRGRHQFVKGDKFLASGRLMVKIQDGCDRFCSYCIVPYLRGKPRSRTIQEIITEIKSYTLSSRRSANDHGDLSHKDCFSRRLRRDRNDNGISEVILTAINTECFGNDTGETLIGLIDAIFKQTTIPKISFGSIHPSSVTDEFLKYYTSVLQANRFIPFFHIPIQSGSNTILKLMNRGYTSQNILRKLKKLKSINPNAFIGTDIIVGFPGEGKREFQETVDFLRKAPVDKIHVFRFSLRPGTAAEKLVKIYGESTAQEKYKRAKSLPRRTLNFKSDYERVYGAYQTY